MKNKQRLKESPESRAAQRIQVKSDRVREAAAALKAAQARGPSQQMLRAPGTRMAWVRSGRTFLATSPDEILRDEKKKRPNRPKQQQRRVNGSGRSSQVRILQDSHPQSYSRYLRSPHWESFKKQYYDLFPKECVACGAQRKIHLHHKTYERIGREEFRDVIALCDVHHAAVHQHSKAHWRLTLAQATDDWLTGYLASTSRVA